MESPSRAAEAELAGPLDKLFLCGVQADEILRVKPARCFLVTQAVKVDMFHWLLTSKSTVTLLLVFFFEGRHVILLDSVKRIVVKRVKPLLPFLLVFLIAIMSPVHNQTPLQKCKSNWNGFFIGDGQDSKVDVFTAQMSRQVKRKVRPHYLSSVSSTFLPSLQK